MENWVHLNGLIVTPISIWANDANDADNTNRTHTQTNKNKIKQIDDSIVTVLVELCRAQRSRAEQNRCAYR